jgi:hypothetical protein
MSVVQVQLAAAAINCSGSVTDSVSTVSLALQRFAWRLCVQHRLCLWQLGSPGFSPQPLLMGGSDDDGRL